MEDYIRNAVVTNIHDGDTITVTVDLGYHVSTTTPLRFNRINAAELSTQAGKDSLAYIQTLVKVGDSVTVKTQKDPTDKYGRWLADIYLANGKCLNDLMVSTNNAVYWDGKGPKIS